MTRKNDTSKEHKEPDMDLEPVALKPRTARGAVVSVRLPAGEAEALAARAESAGLSLSDFTRRLLRRSIQPGWRVLVWSGQAPVTLGGPPQTGGAYNRQSTDTAAPAVSS